MEDKATPRPWYAIDYAGHFSIQNEDHYGGYDLLDEQDTPEAPANAELIVKAINSYDALVEENEKLKADNEALRIAAHFICDDVVEVNLRNQVYQLAELLSYWCKSVEITLPFINHRVKAEFKKRKVAFYSPESYPVDEFLDTFIHSYLGKTTDIRFPHVCSDDEYKKAIKWANDYFYFCDWSDTPNAETLLNAFEYLHTQGCEIFIVDPFNSIVTEGEDRNIAVALKKNLTLFKRFAAQKRVQVWLVEHPKTPIDPKDFENVPTNRHLFGGTMWWNKVDVGVTIHRPNREDKNDRQVLIKTWKVKRQQLNGRPGENILYYDVRGNRYYEDLQCTVHPMIAQDLYAEKEKLPF